MPNRIIDFHTHAFPDALAERAMAQLLSETDAVRSFLDGKLSSLIASMDANGIEASVLCSIATRPSQFEPILQWSQQIASDRIIPLASVHPQDPAGVEHIHQIAQTGLKGVKMHPYYQDFYLDDPHLYPLFEAIQAEGLLLYVATSGHALTRRRPRAATPIVVLASAVVAEYAQRLSGGAGNDYRVPAHQLASPAHVVELIAGTVTPLGHADSFAGAGIKGQGCPSRLGRMTVGPGSSRRIV